MTNQLSLLDTQKMVAMIMNLISLKCDHSRAKHTLSVFNKPYNAPILFWESGLGLFPKLNRSAIV